MTLLWFLTALFNATIGDVVNFSNCHKGMKTGALHLFVNVQWGGGGGCKCLNGPSKKK